MRNDQRWFVQGCNHIGHGKGLSGAGNSQQCFKLVALLESFYKLFDRLWLISRRLIFTVKFENTLFLLQKIHPLISSV